MTVAAPSLFAFDNTYALALPELGDPWTAKTAPAPQLLALNESLANELRVDADALRTPDGVALLVGNNTPPEATPIAQAYSGHQFGNYSPRLGDGRALLVGEVHDVHGHRRDIHLKGSGRTRFARGGDGRAAVGPMLREYVISEAMHALGIPTTRALAVVATGEPVQRETLLPGAVLVRVAASHLRVGTFQYAAAQGDAELLRRLADYAIERHHPRASGRATDGSAESANAYVAFFDAVVDAQASLVAQWMLVGFIHGVMNTDNMTISGETIDYGPCAFMDAYDPATVFSSIDHGGRYAYGNQPQIAHWNLARLGETLLPLFADDADAAVAIANESLQKFPDRFLTFWLDGMRAKLGLTGSDPDDRSLVDDLLALMQTSKADHTSTFRMLAAALRGDTDRAQAFFDYSEAFDAWSARWHARVAAEDGRNLVDVANEMDRVNPVYIPRNHLVEEALAAATDGDLEPFDRLVEVVSAPFVERSDADRYATPAPPDFGRYVTFCGT